MKQLKPIPINLRAAKKLARLLVRLEETTCIGCPGRMHRSDCPAAVAFQLRNYLTQRINNPNRHWTL